MYYVIIKGQTAEEAVLERIESKVLRSRRMTVKSFVKNLLPGLGMVCVVETAMTLSLTAFGQQTTLRIAKPVAFEPIVPRTVKGIRRFLRRRGFAETVGGQRIAA